MMRNKVIISFAVVMMLVACLCNYSLAACYEYDTESECNQHENCYWEQSFWSKKIWLYMKREGFNSYDEFANWLENQSGSMRSAVMLTYGFDADVYNSMKEKLEKGESSDVFESEFFKMIYSCHDMAGTVGDATKETLPTTDSSNWWSNAFNFMQGARKTYNVSALNDIQNLILFVGNMVFVIVTVVLGVKYIWGSVESKASVKESLITLIVAAMFFYGWSTIKALFITNGSLSMLTSDYKSTAVSIYSTVLYIMNFLAVGGIVYIGIRYMLAGAEGKAQLKAKGVPIVLGIVMVYATITFLNLILSVTKIL